MSPSAIDESNETKGSKVNFETRLFINGEFVPSIEGKKFDVYSPFTEEKVGSVYEALPADVDKAVDAAEAVFPAWDALGSFARARFFYKLADLLEAAGPELAHLEALCIGKPISTYMEHYAGAQILRQFAGLSQDSTGGTSLNTTGFVTMLVRQPFGVTGAIVPWNIPVMAAIFKIAPSLITGNTLVLKSSEKTPLTALVLARLIKEAGFPPGVVNVLSGYGKPTGEAIASHMRIRKVGFTGSGRTGRLIKQAAAASNLKRVSLELGGKSPLIIFPDADLEKAAEVAARSITMNSGQACIASSRLYVHESIADTFKEKVGAAMNAEASTSGQDPLDAKSAYAPQADKTQFEAVLRYIDLAKDSGGKIVLGGKRKGDKGYFIEPTIIENPSHDSRVAKEEIFGPVLSYMTFTDEDEVMKRANDTEYGLYASVFTKDIARAMRIAKKFESGQARHPKTIVSKCGQCKLWVSFSEQVSLKVCPFSR
ncbi:aldehyde dehydrogenase [Delphinella strobiligena]|nr:aldehyde dehydrogenase [Delphinella strobiligena]